MSILYRLLTQVLVRITSGKEDGHLIEATLCLIEVSRHGVLESELLDLLADEANLIRRSRRSRDDQNQQQKGVKVNCCSVN
jgi:hypothetical protein